MAPCPNRCLELDCVKFSRNERQDFPPNMRTRTDRCVGYSLIGGGVGGQFFFGFSIRLDGLRCFSFERTITTSVVGLRESVQEGPKEGPLTAVNYTPLHRTVRVVHAYGGCAMMMCDSSKYLAIIKQYGYSILQVKNAHNVKIQ
uniref:Uncharacterized protein n=1 Tax=Anopheles culicifacies TaxID=139723 RepID=A0A182LV94_9DIPT